MRVGADTKSALMNALYLSQNSENLPLFNDRTAEPETIISKLFEDVHRKSRIGRGKELKQTEINLRFSKKKF